MEGEGIGNKDEHEEEPPADNLQRSHRETPVLPGDLVHCRSGGGKELTR